MDFTPPSILTEIISDGNIQLIGNIIEKIFKKTQNWTEGMLAALTIIIIILFAIWLIGKLDPEGETLL